VDLEAGERLETTQRGQRARKDSVRSFVEPNAKKNSADWPATAGARFKCPRGKAWCARKKKTRTVMRPQEVER